MQPRKTLIAAPLVALAIAAPAAPAVPSDPRQLDMHASTVVKPAAPKQDLRSEATVDATPVSPQTHTPVAQQDLRTEAAADKPAPEQPVGLPTWPADPEPIVPVSHEPLATTGDGDGIEWPLSGIVIAGALLFGATVGSAGTRRRLSHA
jgi:hypothetical protein